MMGREVDGAKRRAAREPLQRVNVDAVAIDRDRNDGRSGGPKRFPRGPMAELFDRDDVARADERPGRERERHRPSAYKAFGPPGIYST